MTKDSSINEGNGSGKRLRVGLFLDELKQPYWIRTMLERIISDGCSDIVLVIDCSSSFLKKKGYYNRIKYTIISMLLKMYFQFEKLFYKPAVKALQETDISDLIASADILKTECKERKFKEYIKEEYISKIREYDLDVIIKSGFRILKGDILNVPKAGIWSYYFGDNKEFEEWTDVYYEFLNQDEALSSGVQILADYIENSLIIYNSSSTIANSFLSNINAMYLKSAMFVPRQLKMLAELGNEKFLKTVNENNVNLKFYSHTRYRKPGVLKYLFLFTRKIIQRVFSKLRKFTHFQQWALLYAFNESQKPLTILNRYTKINPPRDRSWADPFVVFENGKYYVFFEELLEKVQNAKGRLCVAEMGKNGFVSEPRLILEKPYHLSYPFVFRHEGDYYMIPESSENKTIDLYRATGFPYSWEYVMTLKKDITAVDATIIFHNERYWMFTNIVDNYGGASSEELCIFYSDNLFSDNWKPHSANPVISDVRSSRPAGKILALNNKLYRPSQNCSVRYGYSVVVNEIVSLNETEYAEKKITALYPEWEDHLLGTHTLSHENQLSMIDVLQFRSKFF